MANFPNPGDPASLPPPRPVVWARDARLYRNIVCATCTAITVVMLGAAVADWRAGNDRQARIWLTSLLPPAVLVGFGDWLMRRERDLARRGQWAAGRVTGSGVTKGGKGGLHYHIEFEFVLPSGEVLLSRAGVPRKVYEELGKPGQPVGVLWDPHRPCHCRPVPAFRFVAFASAEDGEATVRTSESTPPATCLSNPEALPAGPRTDIRNLNEARFAKFLFVLLLVCVAGLLIHRNLPGRKPTLTVLHVLAGPPQGVAAVTFSPDGRRALSAHHDDSIRLWDLDQGNEVRRLTGGHAGRADCVAFAPDGRTALSGGGRPGLCLWDLDTGQVLCRSEAPDDAARAVAFSPDGRRAATAGSDRTVRLWDAADLRQQRRLEGHLDRVNAVAFSPDGRRLLSGGGRRYGRGRGNRAPAECGVRLWDAEDGRLLRRWPTEAGVEAVAFAADGRQVVAADEHGTVLVWDAADGHVLRRLEGKINPADRGPSSCRVALFAGGRRAAWVCQVYLKGDTVRLYDVESGAVLHSGYIEPDRQAFCLAGSPDGARLLSNRSDGTLWLWAWPSPGPRGEDEGLRP
jgi:WD40 repeat protein